MRGAIPSLPYYVFMAWCLVKHRDRLRNSGSVRTTDEHRDVCVCVCVKHERTLLKNACFIFSLFLCLPRKGDSNLASQVWALAYTGPHRGSDQTLNCYVLFVIYLAALGRKLEAPPSNIWIHTFTLTWRDWGKPQEHQSRTRLLDRDLLNIKQACQPLHRDRLYILFII
jgi:hypothetical protein